MKINRIFKINESYHILPGYKKLPHKVNFKFFGNKNTAFIARKRIIGKQGPKKDLITQFDEKLPPLEPNLGNEIASLGYITSSNNCVVTVKSYKDDVYSIYIPVMKKEQLHKLKVSIKNDKRIMDKRIVTNSENSAAALGDKDRINRRTQLFNSIKKACHGDTLMQNEKLRLQTHDTLGLFLKKLLFF